MAIKNVDVYSFLGGRGSQKVYGLYTHENVDIYGWPLRISYLIKGDLLIVGLVDCHCHMLTLKSKSESLVVMYMSM